MLDIFFLLLIMNGNVPKNKDRRSFVVSCFYWLPSFWYKENFKQNVNDLFAFVLLSLRQWFVSQNLTPFLSRVFSRGDYLCIVDRFFLLELLFLLVWNKILSSNLQIESFKFWPDKTVSINLILNRTLFTTHYYVLLLALLNLKSNELLDYLGRGAFHYGDQCLKTQEELALAPEKNYTKQYRRRKN